MPEWGIEMHVSEHIFFLVTQSTGSSLKSVGYRMLVSREGNGPLGKPHRFFVRISINFVLTAIAALLEVN